MKFKIHLMTRHSVIRSGKKVPAGALFSLIVAACLSGCITTEDPAANTALREDMHILREDMNRMQSQVETAYYENQRMSGALANMRMELENNPEREIMQQRLNNLEAQIQSINAAREKDKQAIVEQISARVAELIAQNARAQRVAPQGDAGTHTVQPGETLSTIAAAYKVRTSAIIEANRLKNPDRLTVGQKLIIP